MKIIDQRGEKSTYFYQLRYGDFFEFEPTIIEDGTQIAVKTADRKAYIFKIGLMETISSNLKVTKLNVSLTIED